MWLLSMRRTASSSATAMMSQTSLRRSTSRLLLITLLLGRTGVDHRVQLGLPRPPPQHTVPSLDSITRSSAGRTDEVIAIFIDGAGIVCSRLLTLMTIYSQKIIYECHPYAIWQFIDAISTSTTDTPACPCSVKESESRRDAVNNALLLWLILEWLLFRNYGIRLSAENSTRCDISTQFWPQNQFDFVGLAEDEE